MLGTLGRIGRKLALAAPLAALALGALGLASCGVTEPEENPWQDVSKFSWPLNTSTRMTYERRNLSYGQISSVAQDTLATVAGMSYEGRQWYKIDDPSTAASVRIQYRATSDTLLMANAEFGGSLQLVSPIEKGRTWISPLNYDTQKPGWKATVIQQYSVLQLDYKQYKNVVVVKYEQLDRNANTGPVICYRYFAEGIGPIKSVQNSFEPKADISYEPKTAWQKILLTSTASQN